MAPAHCTLRFIAFDALYRDIYSCSTGPCYARKFLAIDRAPIVVVFPQFESLRAQAVLHDEMVTGVEVMGATLRNSMSRGAAGLPSFSELETLTDRAITDVGFLDPLGGQSDDERRCRLGVGPNTKALAQYFRGS
jgi:hypothetical protein